MKKRTSLLTNTEDERVRPKKRQRGFSETLPRVQIRPALPEQEKAGASKTFFTKVKEEPTSSRHACR